jgi:nucleoid-associated protein Lsr2
MAERMVRQLIDDIDGTEIRDGDGDRVVLTLRGTTYQIDLSSSNLAKLERALKPFLAAAVPVRRENGRASKKVVSIRQPRTDAASNGRRKPVRKGKATARTRASKEDPSSIRDWARKNGYDVPQRGRLRTDIIEAFQAAQ